MFLTAKFGANFYDEVMEIETIVCYGSDELNSRHHHQERISYPKRGDKMLVLLYLLKQSIAKHLCKNCLIRYDSFLSDYVYLGKLAFYV